MLTRWLEYWTTPCSWSLRRMGYLSEILGIKARHHRCRAAWMPHLERTKDAIREGIKHCQRRRKAVVLGSGMLLDIPLRDLATFDEVVLVDLIHPWQARWGIRKFRQINILAADVSATVESVLKIRTPTTASIPRGVPSLFLDDPAVDFVASVNLLSQLPYIPLSYLERHKLAEFDQRRELARGLIHDHLSYLKKFACPVTIVADLRRIALNDGAVFEDFSALHDVEFPWPGTEWNWELAPRPEAHRVYSYRRRVIAVPNIHACAEQTKPLGQHDVPK